MRLCSDSPGVGTAGFTFVEVLVAIVFIAIVVPITVEAIMRANRAGSVSEKKRVATRLAEYKLAEMVLTDDWRYGAIEGDFGEDYSGYTWTITEDAWDEDVMLQLTVTVGYTVQGRSYEVSLSTLVPETEETSGGNAVVAE